MKNILYIIPLLLVTSCGIISKSPKDNSLNYMRDIDSIAIQASKNATKSTVQPSDLLMIFISAKDLDVVKPFNQNYSSGQAVQESMPGGNLRQDAVSIAGPTYLVDSNGQIDFPILGEISVTGKTLEEFKYDLKKKLRLYIKEPVVTVRNTNYKITVLGEVNKPGQYVIIDGKATVLDALGLAGDLTMYGKRNDVLIVRNFNGETTKERIDLNNADFLDSSYYYLKQGDVIYVSANKSREIAANQNPNTGLYISVASVALGLLGLLVTVFKK